MTEEEFINKIVNVEEMVGCFYIKCQECPNLNKTYLQEDIATCYNKYIDELKNKKIKKILNSK